MTAQQQAYSFLREKILSGEYAGGFRLNPEHVAQVLEISRMPVREAFRQLDAEGLIIMRPNRGAVVTTLTVPDVEELFGMRAVLEGLAMRYARARLSSHDLDELTALKQGMDRARHDVRLWLRRHDEFHQFICEIGRCTRLRDEISRVRLSVQPYLLMYITVYHSSEMAGYEHDSLIAALSRGDATAAETAMRDHVMRASSGVLDFLRSRGHDGEVAPAAILEPVGKSGTHSLPEQPY